MQPVRVHISGDAVLTGVPYVSPSRLSVLRDCERRFYHQYALGKREPGTEATAMGAAFAVALEFDDPHRAINEYHTLRPELDPFAGDQEKYELTGLQHQELILAAFNAYRKRFSSFTDPKREVTYLTRIPETDHILQCRVDGIAFDGSLIEDKLRSGSSLRPDHVLNEVRQGFQLSAEIWSHLQATGEHVAVNFRTIKKPDPRVLRRITDRIELRDFLSHHFAIESNICSHRAERTTEQLEEFEKELRRLTYAADDILGMNAEPVRNTSHCFSYGRACPFIDDCQSQS